MMNIQIPLEHKNFAVIIQKYQGVNSFSQEKDRIQEKVLHCKGNISFSSHQIIVVMAPSPMEALRLELKQNMVKS